MPSDSPSGRQHALSKSILSATVSDAAARWNHAIAKRTDGAIRMGCNHLSLATVPLPDTQAQTQTPTGPGDLSFYDNRLATFSPQISVRLQRRICATLSMHVKRKQINIAACCVSFLLLLYTCLPFNPPPPNSSSHHILFDHKNKHWRMQSIEQYCIPHHITHAAPFESIQHQHNSAL